MATPLLWACKVSRIFLLGIRRFPQPPAGTSAGGEQISGSFISTTSIIMIGMTKKRDKIEIAAAILEICRTPQRKTKIVYACNLNFHTADLFLDLLQREKLLAVKNGQFETTNAGLKTYMKITELYKLLGWSP